MNLKNSISLIRHGIYLFSSLLHMRPFLWAYLLCFGVYDFFSALYSSARPSDVTSQWQLSFFVGGNLSLFMSVFALLLLNGNQKIFSGRTWKLISRTWSANFVAGSYIILGFICMIVPGIVLSLRYLYINQAIVVENLGISAALARSRKLSAVNGGRTFWAVGIVAVACVSAVTLCGVSVSIVSGDAALNTFTYNYATQIFFSLSSCLIAACVYSGYLDVCALEAGKYVAPSSSSQAGQELADDRDLGRTYAQTLSSCSAATLQQRQAFLRDLLGDNLTLWHPLRHLIEQPAFITMLQAQSPSSRIAARDSLLQELDGHYLPQVMERVRAFMGGLLER